MHMLVPYICVKMSLYCLYRYLTDSNHRAYVDGYRSKSVRGNTGSVCPSGGLKLALGYRSRVGKDTAADTIVHAHGGHILRIAEPVYDAATQYLFKLRGTAWKYPELLQMTGTLMRESRCSPVKVAERKIREIELYGVYMRHNWGIYTPISAMIKLAYNACTGRYIGRNMVIVDLRYPDEVEMLKKHGFETVKVMRDDYEKVIDRDTKHISEWGLNSHQFDHEWRNSGTIEAWQSTVLSACAGIIARKAPVEKAP
ncbi:hypothetical protein D5b_00133 [Faustovirus]|nr:hypothetical protein D5b_00133 [Faustovirus]